VLLQIVGFEIGVDNGHVVEKGSHSELMKNRGLYYQLIMNQTIEDEGVSSEEISVDRDVKSKSFTSHSRSLYLKEGKVMHVYPSDNDHSPGFYINRQQLQEQEVSTYDNNVMM